MVYFWVTIYLKNPADILIWYGSHLSSKVLHSFWKFFFLDFFYYKIHMYIFSAIKPVQKVNLCSNTLINFHCILNNYSSVTDFRWNEIITNIFLIHVLIQTSCGEYLASYLTGTRNPYTACHFHQWYHLHHQSWHFIVYLQIFHIHVTTNTTFIVRNIRLKLTSTQN